MKKTYKHIGYYNDINDCKTLFTLSPDEVVSEMINNYGAFHSVDGDDDTDVVWGDEHDMHLFLRTKNEKYAVRYERGNDKEGWFIDIYKLREPEVVEVNDKKSMVEEYCPHCDEDIMLENELKVQRCPNCGRLIIPCTALCPFPSSHDCEGCPLLKICIAQDKIYEGEVYTPDELVSLVNTLSTENLERGFYITVPKVKENDNTCDEELYLHHNPDYNAMVMIDVAQHGKAFTWSGVRLQNNTLHNALWSICGRNVDTMYVRKNYV